MLSKPIRATSSPCLRLRPPNLFSLICGLVRGDIPIKVGNHQPLKLDGGLSKVKITKY